MLALVCYYTKGFAVIHQGEFKPICIKGVVIMKKLIRIAAAALTMLMVTVCFAGCEKKNVQTDASVASQSSANSDYQYIMDKGEMIVGVTKYEPMDYKDENGKWVGFDAEFAEAVGKKLGVKIKFIEIDWDNKVFELESKSIDCVWNGMTLNEKVLSQMSCSDPYVINAQVVVMKADEVANYKDAASMKDIEFAVEKGSAGEDAAKDAKFNYTAVNTQADALMEVASGSADACVIDITMAKAMTGKGTSYENLGISISLTSEEYGIGFRKGSDMTEKINGLISELKADGTLDDLAKKYKQTLVD